MPVDNIDVMEVILYLVGALLFLLCIEIFILILEVVKVSSSLQSYFITQSKNQDQVHIEKKSLISLLAKFANRGIPVGGVAAGQGSSQGGGQNYNGSTQTTSGGESTGQENQSGGNNGGEANNDSDNGSEQGGVTSDEEANHAPPPPDSRSAMRISQRPREEQKQGFPKTKPTSTTVRKCPYCGKENSAFRKKCYFCNNTIPDE